MTSPIAQFINAAVAHYITVAVCLENKGASNFNSILEKTEKQLRESVVKMPDAVIVEYDSPDNQDDLETRFFDQNPKTRKLAAELLFASSLLKGFGGAANMSFDQDKLCTKADEYEDVFKELVKSPAAKELLAKEDLQVWEWVEKNYRTPSTPTPAAPTGGVSRL